MIFGIGTDIVSVARMEAGLARFGDKFAHRILAECERGGFETTVRKANYLAKRFAAKEAAAKALGTGFIDGLTLKQITVGHDSKGKPLLQFHGRAEQLCRTAGVGEAHISLADEHDYAVAFVTLLKR